MGKKLAIIFPGVGYTCAKPLLYYTAQLAAEYDYEVIRLDYGMDIHNFKGRTMEDLIPVAVTAKERILAQMKEINPIQYKDIPMLLDIIRISSYLVGSISFIFVRIRSFAVTATGIRSSIVLPRKL